MPELQFKGKEFVYNHHLTVPYRPLEMDASKSVGKPSLSDNLIIHGDNLHALKALLPLYAGEVDCVFIDPPYNTGNEGWSYNDNVNSPMMKEWLSSNPVNAEDMLRHDKWCAMMYPRRNSGGPIDKSVFVPVYREDYNRDERDFACYLDELAAIRWWHRNVAKAGNYWVQGWKKRRVYPDFLFAHERSGKTDRILVWETKGDQFEGNLDTKYKSKLLETMTEHYSAEDGVKAGTLRLVGKAGEEVECELVLMSEWRTAVERGLEGWK
jgi:DNA modification methylase